MRYISTQDYADLHKDFKGVWSSDQIHSTQHNGKRTMVANKNGSTVLLIEGEQFLILEVDKDGVFVHPCEECLGDGFTEEDVSQYSDITPQYEKRECEECNGQGEIETEYYGF